MTGEQLGQARADDRARRQAQHGLEAPVAAHQRAAAQIGDAGGRALEDRRHLAQQLLAAPLADLLVGDVEGDDRRGALARSKRRRLDPRQQPALAELGMDDAVAHLGALGALQRQLQPLVLGERLRRDDLAADVLQHRRRAAARLRPLPHPARRFLEGGDADAGGVHHGADLDPRQVALFLDAAVLDDAHVAALAARRAIAADDRAQAPERAAGGGDPALRLDRPRAGLERRERAAFAPREQARQVGIAVGERDRHAARHPVERRVGADQQAAVVEQDHADRAEVEPVVELAHRAVGALARGVLAGRVLEHGEVERRAALARQDAARGAVPALEAARVDQPALAQRRRVGAAVRRHQHPALLEVGGAVLLVLQLDRVAADEGGAIEAGELDEGVVDVDDQEVGVLQRRRKRRLPEDLQRLANRRRQPDRGDACARPHSRAPAPISARSCARLISATLISSCSAASRYSNTDSPSAASTIAMYGWYGPVFLTSAW